MLKVVVVVALRLASGPKGYGKVKESHLQGSWGEFLLFHHETIECTERIVLQDLLKIVTVLFKIFTQPMQHPIS